MASITGRSDAPGCSVQFHIIYVGVNAVREGQRTRTKEAIAAVRHIFLEADHGGPEILRRIEARADLPPLSYILESSSGRLHFFWRVTSFSAEGAERLQKRLASELDTDRAATSCAQTTRIAGFRNHKRTPHHLITVQYRYRDVRYGPESFPQTAALDAPLCRVVRSSRAPNRRSTVIPGGCRTRSTLSRARRAGDRWAAGDLHTFRVCCRIVRGFFDLDDAGALSALHPDRALAPLRSGTGTADSASHV
ncbi:MAG: RepB family DNA primase [Acidobacteria bacterium]|nr:RepB family DNA primase [Acidobacteriota bacterium]